MPIVHGKARNPWRPWINEWLQDYKTTRVAKVDKCAKTLHRNGLSLAEKKKEQQYNAT